MRKTEFRPYRKFICVFALTMAAACLSEGASPGSQSISARATMDIDFEGGSFAGFKEAFFSAYPTNLNFKLNIVEVNPNELKRVEVPAIHLGNVTAGDIFGVLNSVADVRCKLEADNTVLVEAIFDQEPRRLLVYPLSPLTEMYEVDDILGLMTQAYVGTMDTSIPNLSLHQETELLLLSGTPEQLDIAKSVLRGLESAAEIKRKKDEANAKDQQVVEELQQRIIDLTKAGEDEALRNKQLEQKSNMLEVENKNLRLVLERMTESIPATDK